MAILAWVPYHHGDNREAPHMAARGDIVRFNAQVIATTRKGSSIQVLILDVTQKAHRGKACVDAQRLVKSIQKRVQNGPMNGGGALQFGWRI